MAATLSTREFKSIVDFARQESKANDFNHNIRHIELTAKIAALLAGKEGANVEICIAAAYLHDIGRSGTRGKHGVHGARMARSFLKKMKLPQQFVNEICYAITQHDRGSPKRTAEARVLWDADKLQSVGPLGFMRIFAHHLSYDTKDIIEAERLTQQRHNFFYKRFKTKTGRMLAKKLHSFMHDFYRLSYSVTNAEIERIY